MAPKKKRQPLNAQRLQAINRQVYREFPEIQGARPNVHRLRPPSANKEPRLLLTYRRQVTTADGRRLTRIVRVLATLKGKILKITTSR